MIIIDIFLAFVILAILILVFTQVWVPLIIGKRLFPDFRTSPLTERVAELKENVEVLQERNNLQQQLNVLAEKHNELTK